MMDYPGHHGVRGRISLLHKTRCVCVCMCVCAHVLCPQNEFDMKRIAIKIKIRLKNNLYIT